VHILFNAHILTFDGVRPRAAAMVVANGRILDIGDDRAILSEFKDRCPAENIADIKGKTVIPGLIDAHIHLQSYALALKKVDCETSTKSECLERIAERVRYTPPGKWILGHGWNHNEWPECLGSAAELDLITPDNPVYLTAKSLHAAWANSQALREAHITAATLDPAGGRLERNSRGEATGILLEKAMQLVSREIPVASSEDVLEAIEDAQQILWRLGLTGVHDFDRRACFVALQTLHLRDKLRLRVIKSIPFEDLDHAVALGLRSGFGDEFIRIGSLKLFSDGALGQRTAAMLEPYEGELNNRGMLMMDAEEMFDIGRVAVDNDISLAVHGIGDRANHEVLKALAQLKAYEVDMKQRTQSQAQNLPGENITSSGGSLRHRIEHLQIIHPADAARLSELDVIASMQPVHATSDMIMADRYWGERSELAYAWKAQLDSGAVLAFGSDAPVESPNPFWGIHAAVTRRRRDGTPDKNGWYPEQKIKLNDALFAYTKGASYAAGMEKKTGKLIPGFLADLVVLDTDPFNCVPEQLWGITPVSTMIGGEWVYRS